MNKIQTDYKPILPPPAGFNSRPLLRIIKENGEITEVNILTRKTLWQRWRWWIISAGFVLLIAWKIYTGQWQL